jgi:hypothetical protein
LDAGGVTTGGVTTGGVTIGGVTTGGVTEVGDRAVAIACIWFTVRVLDSEPIPPILPLIALWIRARVAPSLEDVARGPWHPAQILV